MDFAFISKGKHMQAICSSRCVLCCVLWHVRLANSMHGIETESLSAALRRTEWCYFVRHFVSIYVREYTLKGLYKLL